MSSIGSAAGAAVGGGVIGGVTAGAAAGSAAATLGVTGGVAASAAVGTAGSLAGSLGGALGGLAGGVVGTLTSTTGLGLLATGLSTGLSIKQSKDSGAAQAKSAEQTQAHQNQVLAQEGEQKRQVAGTELETAAIQGAKAVGQVRASGLSDSSVTRLAREARAMSLRDLSDITTNFDFTRSAQALTARGNAQSLKNTGRNIKAEVGGRGSNAVLIGTNLLSRGLQIGAGSF
jgi:hypothetical protein